MHRTTLTREHGAAVDTGGAENEPIGASRGCCRGGGDAGHPVTETARHLGPVGGNLVDESDQEVVSQTVVVS